MRASAKPSPTAPTSAAESLRLIDLSHLQLTLLWAYEGEPPALNRSGQHYNPSLTAWLLTRGSVTVHAPDSSMRASAGEWLFPAKGHNFREFSPRARLLSICFRANFSPRRELFEEYVPRQCRSQRWPELESAARPLLDYVSARHPESRNHMMLEQFSLGEYIELVALLAGWVRAYYTVMCALGAEPRVIKQLEQRVSALKTHLDQMPLSEPLDLPAIAAGLGLGAPQLTRLFQQSLGLSPIAYVAERKLRHAQNMLIETKQPIKQLAYDLGFRDPAHFTNWFIQRTRMTPSRYRMQS